jgi:acetylornithine deacetylase/succinyl-diaminopimelate desuccinylase-like protein
MIDDAATTTTAGLRARVAAIMPAARADLERLVRIPSVSAPGYPQAPLVEAAEAVAAIARRLGLRTRLVDVPGSSPAVLAERPAQPGAPTVLLYAHYDVQPPGPEERWTSPPYTPVERDGRLFGRGAADDKSGVVVHATALAALGADRRVGVKLLVEGAEEVGAGALEELVHACPDLFGADVMVIADLGNAALGEPTLTTSLRGMVKLTVSVSTLAGPVHSGAYGGAAPDALVALVRMLATLHDDAGDVAVAGLDAYPYDGPAWDEAGFRREAGVLDGVALPGTGAVADRVLTRPSITITGLDATPVAEAVNAVVPTARAVLAVRLAPGQTPAVAGAAVARHLRAVAPWNVALEIAETGAGEGFLARTDGPAFATARRALEAAFGRPVVRLGQGGSIPLVAALLDVAPQAEVILWGAAEPQARIHGTDESVDLAELERCALAEALFLSWCAEGTGR